MFKSIQQILKHKNHLKEIFLKTKKKAKELEFLQVNLGANLEVYNMDKIFIFDFYDINQILLFLVTLPKFKIFLLIVSYKKVKRNRYYSKNGTIK